MSSFLQWVGATAVAVDNAAIVVAFWIGAVLLVTAAVKFVFTQTTTETLLVAVLGLALILSPKLKSLSVAGATIELAERTSAVTDALTQTVTELGGSLADLNKRQTELATQLQRLVQTSSSPSIAAQVDPIIKNSQDLQNSLDRQQAVNIAKVRSLQQELARTIDRVRANAQ
jgi:hypothetical protein